MPHSIHRFISISPLRAEGSRELTSFSYIGPQILKVVGRGEPTVWKNTSAITLVSNWLATMFCADGEIKGVDEVSFPSLTMLKPSTS
jgi:hypothetical protein